MVPVGSLTEHQRLVVDKSLAHLGNAEHRAILVHHPGIHRGVDIKPLLQLLRPDGIDDVALVVEWIGRHTGNVTGRDAYREIHLAK